MKKKQQFKIPQNAKLHAVINDLKIRLKPLENYYLSKTERERQILLIGGLLLGLMFLYLMVSSVISFGDDIQTSYSTLQSYKADADYLVKRYKFISKITPNEFTPVNVDRIKGDITQALEVKNPDVQVIDSTLVVKVTKAKFSAVMQLLNEFRKSYGIYPDKLKITRLSDSGFVSINISFYNVNKDHE